ncbi:MAG: sulfurtransferase [Candidatus Sericytochromatia bacterium]|nr:sulfurtransferase [Candidatus Sericytochromatia bacterium]
MFLASLLLTSALVVEPTSSMIPPIQHDMLVSTDWLEQHLKDPEVLVLHVANDGKQFVQGHIPGARFLSWSQVATTRNGIENELPPLAELVKSLRELGVTDKHRLVLYDEGAGLQAARAFVALDYVGLGQQTALLNGHWKVWSSENRPVGKEINKIPPSQFQPQLNLDLLIHMPQVQDVLWLKTQVPSAKLRLLDARPAAQYTGAEPGEGITRGGHIPGAINLFWMNHVESEARPLLKSPEALYLMFKQAGFAPGSEIITYCRTGGQASHSYFMAKYLGYKTRLYDGSFSEWSREPLNPVTSGKE